MTLNTGSNNKEARLGEPFIEFNSKIKEKLSRGWLAQWKTVRFVIFVSLLLKGTAFDLRWDFFRCN